MDVLIPVWNGAMEAAGLVPGLSGFIGRSTLVAREMVYVEDPASVDGAPRQAKRAETVAAWDRSRDGEALAMLQRGVSLRCAARALGTTVWNVRGVAKRLQGS